MKSLRITIAILLFLSSTAFGQDVFITKLSTGEQISIKPGEKLELLTVKKHVIKEISAEVYFVSENFIHTTSDGRNLNIPISNILAFRTLEMKNRYEASKPSCFWSIPFLILGITSENFKAQMAEEVSGKVQLEKVKEAYQEKNYESIEKWKFELTKPNEKIMKANY